MLLLKNLWTADVKGCANFTKFNNVDKNEKNTFSSVSSVRKFEAIEFRGYLYREKSFRHIFCLR